VTRSKKIRVYPDRNQRALFSQWFGVQRLTYNKTVEFLKTEEKMGWMSKAKGILSELPVFAKEVPFQVKKIAVRDAYQAISTGIKKFKITGKPFDLSFKSRKNPVQSCFIPKSAVTTLGVYHSKSGHLKMSEELPEAGADCRLVKDNNRYFLSVPYKKPISSTENQGRLVAIDPGVRSFLSFYSSENQTGHIGTNDFGRIVRLAYYLDDLISRTSKTSGSRKQRMRKAAARMRWKIKNLIQELHAKSAKFLTDSFDIILLPFFPTKDMASKARRKIKAKSVRSILTLAHYKFQQRLLCKAEETGKKVVLVNESWTSKTNSWTGEVNHTLGGAKHILVGGIRINRDINGARNILIKWVAENMRALGDSPAPKGVRCEALFNNV